MKELEEVVLLGDGVLVQKPKIENKIGSLHLPDNAAKNLLPTLACEVVAVGPGDQKPMAVKVGDVAYLPQTQQYAEVVFDNKTYYIITQYNILYVKRKK